MDKAADDGSADHPGVLSKLWVRLIVQKPKEMVYPSFGKSAVHDMVMRKENYVEGISNAPTTFKESVRIALDDEMDKAPKSGKLCSREERHREK